MIILRDNREIGPQEIDGERAETRILRLAWWLSAIDPIKIRCKLDSNTQTITLVTTAPKRRKISYF